MQGVAVLHSGDYLIMAHHLVFCAAMTYNIEVVSLAPVCSVRTGMYFKTQHVLEHFFLSWCEKTNGLLTMTSHPFGIVTAVL